MDIEIFPTSNCQFIVNHGIITGKCTHIIAIDENHRSFGVARWLVCMFAFLPACHFALSPHLSNTLPLSAYLSLSLHLSCFCPPTFTLFLFLLILQFVRYATLPALPCYMLAFNGESTHILFYKYRVITSINIPSIVLKQYCGYE